MATSKNGHNRLTDEAGHTHTRNASSSDTGGGATTNRIVRVYVSPGPQQRRDVPQVALVTLPHQRSSTQLRRTNICGIACMAPASTE